MRKEGDMTVSRPTGKLLNRKQKEQIQWILICLIVILYFFISFSRPGDAAEKETVTYNLFQFRK